jgi:type IV secretion system protein VirB4
MLRRDHRVVPVERLASREAYERFGLNDRQIELVSRATPKRQYYLQSARGNRLFELGLGPIALALCGASDSATQARIDAMIAEGGTLDFAARFLVDVGLDWAADLLAGFEDDTASNEQYDCRRGGHISPSKQILPMALSGQ